MLKHANIIRQLSDNDKIYLLSDIRHLSDKQYKVLGIPSVKMGYWKDYCKEDYPSMAELAHSWDMDLISRTAKEVFARMTQDDVTLAIIPGPKPRVSPFRWALCEDPALARTLTNVYIAAAREKGLSCCITDFALYEDETEWIDAPMDTRAIREYIIKPYAEVAENNDCAAIMLEYVSSQEQETPNQLFCDAIKSGELGTHILPLFRSIPEKYTVSAITHGDLCIKCSATALESALKRYNQLKKIVGNSSSTEALSQECAQGSALSPETLDIAIDRLIEFAHSIKRQISTPDVIDPSLPLTATLESIVLLKNEQMRLPLSKAKKLCLIGDFQAETTNASSALLADQVAQQLTQMGYTIIGTARGYDIQTDRSEHLISDAVALVNRADAAIVFFGPDLAGEAKITRLRKSTIPANQQQLLDSLREQKDKVIAIMPGEYSLDIGPADCCATILQAPLHTKHTVSALAQVVSGQYNPCGKLANTVYLNSVKQHAVRKNLRHRDGMKVGPFMGYRYYDREQCDPGFSFGHGDGYSPFSYSQFSISGDKVRLTVTNEGTQNGVEIVQLYVGIQDSCMLRHAKELTAFTRVALKPGEQKTVELTVKWPLVFLSYDNRWIRERGNYTVYVGSSVSNIQWTHTIFVDGETPKADHAKISDYIPSESNIIIDQFTLEAKRKPMKKSAFNFVAGALSLALAIALKLYCEFTNVNTAFFNIFTLILLFSGVSFFIKEAVNRNHAYHVSEQEQQQANDKLFENAEVLPVYSAQNMFVKEFDEVEDIAQEADSHKETIDNNTMAHVDKEYTMSAAVQDFIDFAAEKGYRFSEQTVTKLFSSLASSRLAVVYDMEQSLFRTLMSVVSSFFESPLYIDKVDAQYKQSESVLFKNDASGQRAKTNVFSAIEAARTTPQTIFFATLTEVRACDLSHYFTPYASHAQNPYSHHPISVWNGEKVETSYFIPENLWFVLNLAKGQSVIDLPDFIVEAATVNTFAFDSCKPSTAQPRPHKFTYYQMEYLVEKAGNVATIQEDHWKKVDRLVEYVSARRNFHIGNKLWLHFEKYIFALLACETDVHEALDIAISAKLLPPIIISLKGNDTLQSDWLLQTIEDTLGEEHMQACKQLLHFDSRNSSK